MPSNQVPDADETGVRFALADRSGRLAGVRLAQELGIEDGLDFTRTSGVWTLHLPRPDVDRMEYLFELEDHNGRRNTITDPANPLSAPGAFGAKSVVEFPGYRIPSWLDQPADEGSERPFEIDAPSLGSTLGGSVWAPSGLAEATRAPLLVVHDGPEYAGIGGFTRYLGASIASGALPPVRAALIAPGDRNAWYAANEDYAAALAGALAGIAPADVRIGVGVSLGALAMLHLHRSYPSLLDGLLLQSGSYFTPVLDAQESSFSGFGAVTGFVASVHAARVDPHPVPALLTCGGPEENLANNRAMAATLRGLGYPSSLVEVRDAHNYTAWRDALDPHLTALIASLVAAHAA